MTSEAQSTSRWQRGAALAATLAVLGGVSGCFTRYEEDRIQRLRVTTRPPAAVLVRDARGLLPLGASPVTIEQRYTATVERFRHWHWIWPAIFTGGLAGGLYLTTDGQRGREGAGAALGAISGVALFCSLIANIVFEAGSGRVVSASPSEIKVWVQAPGQPPVERSVTLALPRRGEDDRITTTILDANPPSSQPATRTKAPAPRLPRGTRLAVFEASDQTGSLSVAQRRELGERLALRLAGQGLEVVPSPELRAWLLSAGVAGPCSPGTCQALAGSAVRADKTVATRVVKLRGGCAVHGTLTTASLYFAHEERAVTVLASGCAPAALLTAIDQLAGELGVE